MFPGPHASVFNMEKVSMVGKKGVEVGGLEFVISQQGAKREKDEIKCLHFKNAKSIRNGT